MKNKNSGYRVCTNVTMHMCKCVSIISNNNTFVHMSYTVEVNINLTCIMVCIQAHYVCTMTTFTYPKYSASGPVKNVV